MDALVRSDLDAGERYEDGDLTPAPDLVVATERSAGGRLAGAGWKPRAVRRGRAARAGPRHLRLRRRVRGRTHRRARRRSRRRRFPRPRRPVRRLGRVARRPLRPTSGVTGRSRAYSRAARTSGAARYISPRSGERDDATSRMMVAASATRGSGSVPAARSADASAARVSHRTSGDPSSSAIATALESSPDRVVRQALLASALGRASATRSPHTSGVHPTAPSRARDVTTSPPRPACRRRAPAAPARSPAVPTPASAPTPGPPARRPTQLARAVPRSRAHPAAAPPRSGRPGRSSTAC